MIEISIMILILFILVLLLCIKYKNDHLIRSLKRRIWLIDNMISERRYYGHKDHTFLLKERKNIEDELKPLIYKIGGKRMKIKKQFTTEQLEKVYNENWYRAGGECICEVCGKEYKRHEDIAWDEFFYLTVLCNGELVKL